MSSKIEQLIDEIEDYIDNCRYQPLSKTNIIVNKEEIDELLRELRMKTPEEIKYYQKMLANKEAIINDAHAKADKLIKDAAVHINELTSEHEIMQHAYSEASQVLAMAHHKAQELLNNATLEANEVRSAAVNYLDGMLANLENLMTSAISTTTAHYDSFFNTINSYNEVVKANRAELIPQQVEDMMNQEAKAEESVNLDLVQSGN